MAAKSASLKGLERSTPRTVAPRILPVGSTAAMTPPRYWSGLYCAGLARDVRAAGHRGAGAPPAEAYIPIMKALPGGLHGDQGGRLSEGPRGADHRAGRDRQAVGA